MGKQRHWFVSSMMSVLVLATWLVIFVVSLRFMPQPDPAWTSDSGRPVPEEWFRVLMFPSSSSVPLYDAPDGTKVGTLTRALANTPTEVQSGGWIRVNEKGGASWVRADELTLLPKGQDVPAYIDALSASLKARTGDALAGAEYATEPTSTGTRVTVRVRSENHWQESTYLVQGTMARPEKLVLAFGPAWALMAVPLAAVIATIAVVVVRIATWVWMKRRGLAASKVAATPSSPAR